MESIENIKSVYQRIEDEARCELNKVQQQIYRISTLRLLLFVAGIAGIIYFWTESWAVLTGSRMPAKTMRARAKPRAVEKA